MASEDLLISSFEGVEKLTERIICKSCGRKRMYFCYDCRVFVPGVAELAPRLKLPVSVDVIKHRMEKNGKSTAIHCLLTAPDSTRIFDSPDLPDYSNAINTVLVYPTPSAISVEDYVKAKGPIERFVFLDATWWQVCCISTFSLSEFRSVD
ncbi:hypothetical protein L596_014337 [Steinernema carpocapsae]|uniref:tRNA-uridine aminocarboxypropyltransferase 1 n=1 Tax=Steinernema carpocapsae TaxID=34508 RepID=A0A4U5NCQ8_STECR|nr:hypothetical protein L596_014337 [Steinernema carpocapsae]